MTVLSALFKERVIYDKDLWGPSGKFARGDDIYTDETLAGVRVNRETAMSLSAVWGCVSLISDTISMLPLAAVQKQQIQGRDVRVPLNRQPRWIEEPNPEQERHQFISQQLVSLLLDGTAYVYTVRDSRGDVVEVWNAPPWMVTPRRVRRGRIEYEVQDENGRTAKLNQLEMFHIPAMSWPGHIRGMAPLEAARHMLGANLGAQEFAERYYGQGFTAAGIVEYPGDLQPTQAKELKQDFQRMTGGLRKSSLPAVLTNGATWKPSTVSPEQAQFLETRGFGVTEVARFFRCPPHRIADVERSTSWGSGLEEENIAFVMFTLASWIGRLEQGYSRRILTFGQQAAAAAKFNVNGLMRGRFKDRMEAYAIGVNNGFMCADDINALEDRPPLPNGLGGKFYVQGALRPVDEPYRPETPAPAQQAPAEEAPDE